MVSKLNDNHFAICTYHHVVRLKLIQLYMLILSQFLKKATRTTEFSKIIGYKTNVQILIIFLYISNEQLEIENFKRYHL